MDIYNLHSTVLDTEETQGGEKKFMKSAIMWCHLKVKKITNDLKVKLTAFVKAEGTSSLGFISKDTVIT